MTTAEMTKTDHALEVVTPIVADTIGKARALSIITDDNSFREADGFVSEIKRVYKRVDTERKSITIPIDDAKQAVMDAFKPKYQILYDAEAIIKSGTRKWWFAEQKRKADELKKRQDEDRKRQEDENLRRAADLEKHGNNKQAEAVLNQPIADTKPKVETSFDTSKSYGRKVWRCEITSEEEFLKGVLASMVPINSIEVKIGFLNREATKLKGEVSWPGVKVTEDVEMGVRR